MSMKGIAKNLRTVYSKRLRPPLNLGSLIIRHTEAKHGHTSKNNTYDRHRMELISDVAPLEAVGALERLTASQLRPFEEIVIPALRRLQCSSVPPNEVVIQGWLGQGQHDDNLWQVRLTFPASAAPVERPELITLFAVGADGVIRWEGDSGGLIAEILATQRGV
jgi:hypothetical protein